MTITASGARLDQPCDSCNAAANEPCDTDCIGLAVARESALPDLGTGDCGHPLEPTAGRCKAGCGE